MMWRTTHLSTTLGLLAVSVAGCAGTFLGAGEFWGNLGDGLTTASERA
ncbi:MAG: hypothetical protein ACUVXJ_00700 [Phycisphaerae bacterium]